MTLVQIHYTFKWLNKATREVNEAVPRLKETMELVNTIFNEAMTCRYSRPILSFHLK